MYSSIEKCRGSMVSMVLLSAFTCAVSVELMVVIGTSFKIEQAYKSTLKSVHLAHVTAMTTFSDPPHSCCTKSEGSLFTRLGNVPSMIMSRSLHGMHVRQFDREVATAEARAIWEINRTMPRQCPV